VTENQELEGLQAFRVFTFAPWRFKKVEEAVFNFRKGRRMNSEE